MNTKCKACGHILKHPSSIAAGYGRECAAKHRVQYEPAKPRKMPNVDHKAVTVVGRRRNAARHRLQILKPKDGNQLLFPEIDMPLIEDAEKELKQCQSTMKKLLRAT